MAGVEKHGRCFQIEPYGCKGAFFDNRLENRVHEQGGPLQGFWSVEGKIEYIRTEQQTTGAIFGDGMMISGGGRKLVGEVAMATERH
ncbi:hypothetical protein CEXT_94861 [Caerostris extrusa]|uniref:Uncharacterized protein n=1 Tax=Caerostris extrusa TaxID=172846 RepID=A0AAV4RYF3_CAEEX|nr:hypothetical protein CEXT_94861 [Caerostris extrusa]